MRGFCSGTFSIPHVGHILFLENCKKWCDHLTVMIANDNEVWYKKGYLAVKQEHRLLFFESLRQVDKCILSKNTKTTLDYLYNLLDFLKPDVYFFNEDAFDLEDRINVCNAIGIKIKILSRKKNDSGLSSSKLEELSHEN